MKLRVNDGMTHGVLAILIDPWVQGGEIIVEDPSDIEPSAVHVANHALVGRCLRGGNLAHVFLA